MNGSRQYPERPFVGVGGVILDGDRVVLIRRRFPPLAGEWSLPGGIVEVGETLEACVAREMLEETGLHVDVGPVIDVFDRITRDPADRVEYHYVLVDYLCRATGGVLCAGSDVDAAMWVSMPDLAEYRLPGKAMAMIRRGQELVGGVRRDSGKTGYQAMLTLDRAAAGHPPNDPNDSNV